MKIGLITIHYANSYGGCLQALASQAVLSKYGEVEIIDYKSPALKSTMRLLRYSRSPRCILHIVKDLARFNARKRLLQKFRSFMGRYYRLTESCNDETMLRQLNGKFDFFVCGSDQIWNPGITGGDRNYLLKFVESGECISFSTSAGSYQFTSDDAFMVGELIAKFKKLSFREKSLVGSIAKISGRSDVCKTLDPTLLLDRGEWFKLLDIKPEVIKEKYLFVYTLKKNEALYSIVRHVADKLKLKVVAVDQDPYLRYKTDFHIQDAGPVEFLSLLSNAAFIVTNSFHGTAFAINFGVPFVTIKPEAGSNRVLDLLSAVGLERQFVFDVSGADAAVSETIDFTAVHGELDTARESTFRFLKDAFE